MESAPVIQSRIAGGHAQITMGARDPDIQLADSKKLELVLRSGALPAPITKSNEQRIGPSLGRQSIRLAVQGALGGAILVVIFNDHLLPARRNHSRTWRWGRTCSCSWRFWRASERR